MYACCITRDGILESSTLECRSIGPKRTGLDHGINAPLCNLILLADRQQRA
jgi:hypothetical protein